MCEVECDNMGSKRDSVNMHLWITSKMLQLRCSGGTTWIAKCSSYTYCIYFIHVSPGDNMGLQKCLHMALIGNDSRFNPKSCGYNFMTPFEDEQANFNHASWWLHLVGYRLFTAGLQKGWSIWRWLHMLIIKLSTTNCIPFTPRITPDLLLVHCKVASYIGILNNWVFICINVVPASKFLFY